MENYLEEITVEAKSLAFGGEFVSLLTVAKDPSLIGIKAFVPQLIPGETAVCKVTNKSKNFLRAEVVQILNPSADRIAPPCSYYADCGGCSLQHIKSEVQLNLKAEMAAATISRQGGLNINAQQIQIHRTNFFNYRNRIKLQVSSTGTIGFFKENSNQVVCISECQIVLPEINITLKELQKLPASITKNCTNIFVEFTNQQLQILFYLRADSQILSNREAQSIILEKLSNLPQLAQITLKQKKKNFVIFKDLAVEEYPAGHFSQINNKGNAILTDLVLKHVANRKRVIELYAGAGNFSFPLAKDGVSCQAVEVDSMLVKYAKEQLARSGLKNLDFFGGSCESFLNKNKLSGLVIADPPRSGLQGIINHFNNKQIEKLLYISCSLPDFCRDLKSLLHFGYKLTELHLIDMFPQTHHVELFCVLDRLD